MIPPQSSPSHETQAWACYFLLGCGFLAPWNAFITAVDYFAAVFPGRHIDRLFTVAYLPPCLISLVLFTVYSPPSSLHARILAGYIGFTIILLAVPLVSLPSRWLSPTRRLQGSEQKSALY
jgi:equilibrative nucleoside transporter 1/2/3